MLCLSQGTASHPQGAARVRGLSQRSPLGEQGLGGRTIREAKTPLHVQNADSAETGRALGRAAALPSAGERDRYPLGARHPESWRVANSGPGHRLLARRLGKLVVLIVLEATGKWHRPLHRAFCQAGGFKVAVTDPYRTRQFAKSIGQAPSLFPCRRGSTCR